MNNRLLIKERIHQYGHMWSVSSTVYYVIAGRVMVPISSKRRGHSLGFSKEFLKSSVRRLSLDLQAQFKKTIPVWRIDYV